MAIPRTSKPRMGVGEQMAWISQKWGSNWTVRRARNGLVAVGTVSPDNVTSPYKVQVSYSGNQPKVRVLSPQLRDRGDGKPIPHTYSDDSLCLYRPRYEEWSPSLAIADTIIPWISEWLFYYEVWLVTGDWLGGGEHPSPKR